MEEPVSSRGKGALLASRLLGGGGRILQCPLPSSEGRPAAAIKGPPLSHLCYHVWLEKCRRGKLSGGGDRLLWPWSLLRHHSDVTDACPVGGGRGQGTERGRGRQASCLIRVKASDSL